MHNFLMILAGGIFGTLLMTGALYLLSLLTGKNYKVVGVLSTMVTNHTTPDKGLTKRPIDIIIGTILHYLIGVFFAVVYFYLWRADLIELTIGSALALGVITGIVAIAFWSAFIRLHPNPPAVPIPGYALLVGSCHLLFSLGLYIVFIYFV
ncbi:hypothetical protein [Chitinophaga rhizophila]|uniref:DUF1761 domain-containing protein n=1 Tax=Chitinophaga rhizophila TaxID=2866212 RepID=A0ABS7GKW8_9BACT|nr:hypothetical protein [Chitinophaga rhizophila]MBW8688353.1 hypothetical protein [Chitinophaga rhizophila]